MLLRVAVCALVVMVFASLADARPRWRRRGRTNNVQTNTYTTYNSGYASPASAAASKARQSANGGVKGLHLGGGYGGGYAEGVAYSPFSAQDALNNCCFTGQRTLAASSVVRGSDGWYAVKIFW